MSLEDEMKEAKGLLKQFKGSKTNKWLSSKLMMTLIPSAIIIYLCRHDIASIVWALVVLWAVFLITRAWHDIAIERCKVEKHAIDVDALIKTNNYNTKTGEVVSRLNS